MKEEVFLETERLILKNLSMEDLDEFYEYASHKNVGIHAGWKPHESLEISERTLKEFVDSKEFLSINHKEDNKLIGIIGLHGDEFNGKSKDICRELGYGLAYDYWYKGYMTEATKAVIQYAFNVMNIELLTAYTSSKNIRSQRVIKKLGYSLTKKVEGEWIGIDGKRYDRYYYELRKEEYEMK